MPKRPRDPNQLAKLIVDIATGEAENTVSESKRHPDGRRAGGLRGGPSHAATLTAEQRAEIARRAAKARRKKADQLASGRFSKKLENHAHMLALHFIHYNFCRMHRTLSVTPGDGSRADRPHLDV